VSTVKIIAVDLGKARTGIAVSDDMGMLATPVGTITERDIDRLILRVAEIAKQQKAEEIVVGHPRNMDGSGGESALFAERFAESIAEKTGLAVRLWDERMTTVSAIGILNTTNTRGKKRKAVVDTVAATIILQDYLDFLKNKA